MGRDTEIKMTDAERQYQEGIERGADAIAKEIDQELLDTLLRKALIKSGKLIDKGRFIGKGIPDGTPQDFKDAAETFRHVDITEVCRKINTPK